MTHRSTAPAKTNLGHGWLFLLAFRLKHDIKQSNLLHVFLVIHEPHQTLNVAWRLWASVDLTLAENPQSVEMK